jgi:hypothetical protein
MTKDMSEEQTVLNDETRTLLKTLSKGMLQLHKKLLDQAKEEYEARNGVISSVNVYFQLVIDDPHFAWLRKMSSLIALLDEAVSPRRSASQEEASALLGEVELLMNFKDSDEEFNNRFQSSLTLNKEAVLLYNEVVRTLESITGK